MAFLSPTPAASATAPTSSPLALLRQLEWRVRHAVENVLSGEYRSAFRGRGMEFDQVVKYEFGDDVRDIDWNVTARLGEAYRKKFVEEREVTVLVVFEDSPSLSFGSGAQSKREALLELAGLVMLDGSGLDPNNRMTCTLNLALVSAISRTPEVLAALPVGGRTGTLRKRMLATASTGRVRAKTGTLNSVNALSGYVDTPQGNVLITATTSAQLALPMALPTA